MNKTKTAAILSLGLIVPRPIPAAVHKAAHARGARQATDGSGYAAYIEGRKARLAGSLKRRTDAIERRFMEESRFRARQRDERVSFEQKLDREEAQFLDSLAAMPRERRGEAYSAFYDKMRSERRGFADRMREEGRHFREELIAARAASARRALGQE